MKRAPLLVLAGTVAGFVGVLTFHTRPVSATTPVAFPAGSHYGVAGRNWKAWSLASNSTASAEKKNV